ncbi:hypothetical protein DYBT9275_02055 [Dyadobacter sp. CECT 9275]|uniref:DUF983 domain-containing protein n=1 Tax=Dyadobacter helix TaxID=2822344 RepID=A0A916JAL4_9BACT|nr:DUF983 domain-containing protein [Dyadobacter sp. CECT 9275]CAG4998680.1 hypothetical protein DYBT9275_02055 [Dyadobacter sp. CECT 9275]
MFKGSKIYSILANRCPKCHQGSFFKTNNPYDLKNFDKVHDKCEFCQESFTREPGFYIGSMYVSYALSVALMVVFFLGFVIILDFNMETVLISLLISYVLLIPVWFRLARLIWINIFVKYDRQKASDASARKRSMQG